jgi:hypothetical protein
VATVLARWPGRPVSVGDVEDGAMRGALIVGLRRKGPAFTLYKHRASVLDEK